MSNYATQQTNLDLVNWLSAYFTRRNEPNFSLAKTISTYLALPGLRGFWPMSAFGPTGNAFDQSGNVRTLTYNGNPTYNYDNLAPYIALDGTGDYLSRADESALDITGTETYAGSPGLSFAGWYYFDNAAGSTEYMMAKKATAGNFSYSIRRAVSGVIAPDISVDGTALTTVSLGSPAQATWFYVAMQFDPQNELSGWINDTKTTNTTSIPASIFNSNADFVLGAQSSIANLMTGRCSLCALCASFLSDAIILNLFQQTRGLFGI